jgi:hypothetical protein
VGSWRTARRSWASPPNGRVSTGSVPTRWDWWHGIPSGMDHCPLPATTPPIQPRIEFAGDPLEVVRDDDGIACGGIRVPLVEVPVACHSSVTGDADFQSRLMGSSRPFTVEKLRSRCGDRSRYLTRFEKAARAAVAAGVLLPHHAGGGVPPRVFSDLPEG